MRDEMICRVCKSNSKVSGLIQTTCPQKYCENNATHKCFEEHKNASNECYGLVGGDKSTENLSLTCVDCPYLSMIQD